jgi:2-methylisocitrate lyase-like PEP mutase family enzyme
MQGPRVDQALSRIETALSRIEAAADRMGDSDRALVARHEALRGAVGDALQQLDALIGSSEDAPR